jgi:hypothetical protein
VSVMGALSRLQIGEGGAENNRFASKAPNALTFFLSYGFIEKVRPLVRPPHITFDSTFDVDLLAFVYPVCPHLQRKRSGQVAFFSAQTPHTRLIGSVVRVLIAPPISRPTAEISRSGPKYPRIGAFPR